MAVKAKGMSTPLTRAKKAPTRSATVVDAMKTRAAAGEGRTVPTGDIQRNPDNPVQRSSVPEGLVNSIREVGVIQDLVLVPVDLWRAEHPGREGDLTDAPYVVLAGHRRLAAAKAAERDEVPARIREDFDATTLDSVVLHENVHREALTAIEEALAYQRIMDRHKLSQRALSKHTGVSQSQISKKLRLLALPEGVQAAVADGLVGIEESATLLDESPEVVRFVDELAATIEAADFDLSTLVTRARLAVGAEQAQAAATEQAEKRGAHFAAPGDLADRLGVRPGQEWLRRLTDDDAIDRAQKSGDLVVSHTRVYPTGGDAKVEFFTAQEPPAEPERPAESDHARNDKQRLRANKARRAALKSIVAKPPKVETIRRRLLAWAMDGAGWGSEVWRIAQPLLEAADLLDDADVPYAQVRDHLKTLTEKQQYHAAWVLLVARRDEQVGLPLHYNTWQQMHLDHYTWLIEAGYEAGEWEQQMLATATDALEGKEK